MSTYNKFISNTKAVPIISGNLFEGHNKRFATVLFGLGLHPNGSDEGLFNGYLSLRKNVYVDQTGILDASEKYDSGLESDEDDRRSVHIAVFENRGNNQVAVVGCLRLIVKKDRSLLPIEEFYPEVFEQDPIAVGDVEMSRFISRAEKGKGDNYKIIMSLFRAALSWALQNKTSFAYGVIETRLARAMRSFSSAFKKVGQLRMIKEYNTKNIGIVIDLNKARCDLEKKSFDVVEVEQNKPIFWGRR
ncbi:MAG: acyl-homoserine-lactone synthase [Candidatus Nanosyncoccaceae bacterium]|jgi:N-acyl-L-homoserine lactone synthetase